MHPADRFARPGHLPAGESVLAFPGDRGGRLRRSCSRSARVQSLVGTAEGSVTRHVSASRNGHGRPPFAVDRLAKPPLGAGSGKVASVMTAPALLPTERGG